MTEIAPLEKRLTTALARLRDGVARVQVPQADPEPQVAEPVVSEQAPQDVAPQTDEALSDLRAELAQRDEAAATDRATIDDLTAKLAAAEEARATLSTQLEHHTAEAAARTEALEAELTRERAAAAGFEERLEKLRSGFAARESADSETAQKTAAAMARLDESVQRVQQVNAELRSINGQLRKAVADHVGDAALINSALEAELDALRASREAEAAEVSAVISVLKPIIEEAN